MAAPAFLTEEWLYRIAPDGKSMQAARALARDGAWRQGTTSPDGLRLQASIQGTFPEPYTVRANLSDPERPETSCTCPSYKQPCKHALALLLVAIHAPEQLAVREVAQGRPRHTEGAQPRPREVEKPEDPTTLEGSLLRAVIDEPG